MAKIDNVLQEGILFNRKYLNRHGITNTAIDYYLRSGKIEAILHGLYRKPGPPLKWENIVYSLELMGHKVHVGHLSALSYHGLYHYLKLGPSSLDKIRLYSSSQLPTWVNNLDLYPKFLLMKQNPFLENYTGTTEIPFGTWDWPIKYSTAERAFIESVSTVKTEEEIIELKLMVEGAVNLRPKLLQQLLEECHNIKAKRLFLYLAREVAHPWYNYLDLTKIDLGSGKRQIVQGGVLDPEFLITVPKEVNSGQENSIF
ncbi:MAG: type IV toxin-antitoxin system AbiEi family antitoxin domain-containing protein [Sphaerochaetaceae bacterium]|jgi:hypothetical protein|nr:type IV toxin-antitoxin system AbiEi family antitoxin domain-containing protein [Sphaerochaetaceae bacterium]HHU88211.1 hypothetical protein [Spirochaetales bacterium]